MISGAIHWAHALTCPFKKVKALILMGLSPFIWYSPYWCAEFRCWGKMTERDYIFICMAGLLMILQRINNINSFMLKIVYKCSEIFVLCILLKLKLPPPPLIFQVFFIIRFYYTVLFIKFILAHVCRTYIYSNILLTFLYRQIFFSTFCFVLEYFLTKCKVATRNNYQNPTVQKYLVKM